MTKSEIYMKSNNICYVVPFLVVVISLIIFIWLSDYSIATDSYPVFPCMMNYEPKLKECIPPDLRNCMIGMFDKILIQKDPINYPKWVEYGENPNFRCFGQWNRPAAADFGYNEKNGSYIMATGSATCYTVNSCFEKKLDARLVKVVGKDGREYRITVNFCVCSMLAGNNIKVPMATWKTVSAAQCHNENNLPPP
jgi:hypothetical protein